MMAFARGPQATLIDLLWFVLSCCGRCCVYVFGVFWIVLLRFVVYVDVVRDDLLRCVNLFFCCMIWFMLW